MTICFMVFSRQSPSSPTSSGITRIVIPRQRVLPRRLPSLPTGIKTDGVLITCADDEGAEKIGQHGAEHGLRWLRYGVNEKLDTKAELHGYDIHPVSGKGSVASLCWYEQPVGQLELNVPGLHNVRNALAAFAVAS